MRVLVAMSGGVDSSVAAALLAEAGHEVVGATLKLWGGASDAGCCSVGDVEDARRVAQVLGLDHHVFNYSEEFEREVVGPFVAGHAAGLTPNPCVDCNRAIKFDLLFERARRLGFDAVATGHHARVRTHAGRRVLARGLDPLKDQSYVLGFLDGATLERLVLPVGELTKEQVRHEAARLGLRTWDKPDSQDVCFIEASAGRERFLGARLAFTEAVLADVSTGEVLGRTPAAELLTVGQRRGVAPGRDGERRFVARVDLAARRVEVGRLADVLVDELALVGDSVRFAHEPLADGARVVVQTSAHGRPVTARWRAGRWGVVFEEPHRPVAPGQSVVCYDVAAPDVVVGAAVVAAGTRAR
jgi:tRNA-specific 2-thiouridylase